MSNKFRLTTLIDNVYLPNSIRVFNKELYVTESGRNRVVVHDLDGNFLRSVSIQKGLGFHEPVNVFPCEDEIYVCDWFNHRIIQTDGNNYTQHGIPFDLTRSKWKFFVSSLFKTPTYNKSHFTGIKNSRSETSIKMFLMRMMHYVGRLSLIFDAIKYQKYLNKPNDCIKINDKLFVTQKDNRCISAFHLRELATAQHYFVYNDGSAIGRLGQMHNDGQCVYFCDETNNRLGFFKDPADIHFVSLPKGVSFSVATHDNRIFVASGGNFLMLSKDFQIQSKFQLDCECHGLYLSGDKLFVADRLNNRIGVLHVEA